MLKGLAQRVKNYCYQHGFKEMPVQEKEQRSRENGFEGDEYLAREVASILSRMKIETVIETGTEYGRTAARLSAMASCVYTVEINEENKSEIKKLLDKLPNVRYFFGDSISLLREKIMPAAKPPVLFFLDAHCLGSIETLRKELQVIAEFPAYKNSAIVIHDFFVPGKKFGNDGFKWEQISGLVMKINQEYIHYYNRIAGGRCRGVVFICPRRPDNRPKIN